MESMKILYRISACLIPALLSVACNVDPMPEGTVSEENFNIEAFSDGYSVAFDMTLDRMGGETGTRADDVDDAMIEAWENYIDPEEFRILFFDAEDHFLFESKTRWFNAVSSYDGGNRWRVGVPIFSYLSDNYDENISDRPDLSVDDAYNWDKIMEIMRSKPFKVAILANRQLEISVPKLSDLESLPENKKKLFGKNGPFWSPKNSIASYSEAELEDHKDEIRTVFDLHHCQYDPFYENKIDKDKGVYDFIVKKDEVENVPLMGAVSSWLHPKRVRVRRDQSNKKYFYRLPVSRILNPNTDETYIDSLDFDPIKNQYIPMYGIQQFDALTTWTKGTTYNLSEQVGSQTGDYNYKWISLLRSVVKLELRIPWKDENDELIEVNNEWAQICANNFMARCEPMDTWTPTNELWKDHRGACEWLDIRNYGLYADGTTNEPRKKLSWYFGAWKKFDKWDFGTFGSENVVPEKPTAQYPRIFNPITQRLQITFITDCYLPIEGKYHRWVIYCGEKNMNDPNRVHELNSVGYINSFRIEVTKSGKKFIYHIPITDYSTTNNPAKRYLTEEGGDIKAISDYPAHMKPYYTEVLKTTPENYPLPLLRNHMYRLTVSFQDGDDINVQVMDGERRIVGGIEFK